MKGREQAERGLLEWMSEPLWGEDDERFEEIARALFEHQFAACAPYRRFCEGRGVTPDALGCWREIPPVPTGSFKEVALRSFPAERTVHTFRTSGTSTRVRGELHLDTLALYEASLLPSFCRFLLPDLSERRPEATILVLAPSPGEARDSSLSYMFGVAIRELGDPGSGFFMEREALQLAGLRCAIDAAPPEHPLLLCGTSFAFVHWLDALEAAGERLSLPPRTRIMETGGFKGRSRALPRAELYGALEDRLGVEMDRIVNQYGMTELASQFHDSVLREPGGPRRKLGPPWARVLLIDPESGEETVGDEPGVVVVTDLANTGSVIAIQTADLGQRIGDGFEVLGREPGAEARGCSIAADELLGGPTP